jgi:hypothetical protein
MVTTNNPEELKRIIAEKRERLKELAGINRTTQILREGKSVDESLNQIAKILPQAWQYPEMTTARIRFDSREYRAPNFKKTVWCQSQSFRTVSGKDGLIEIFYLRQFKELDEGPFLNEERDLIRNLASIISHALDSLEAREVIQDKGVKEEEKPEVKTIEKPDDSGRLLLQKFLNKQNSNRNILHDLMPFRVKEILLVATLYDAYSIENEEGFLEQMPGEYHKMNLTTMPRLTGVSSFEEAFEQLNSKHFDLVILMIGTDRDTPVHVGEQIRKVFPFIPIYVLLSDERDIVHFRENPQYLDIVDRLFLWSGDSKIIFTMIKHLEDEVNVENDTRVASVKIIMLVEDSVQYYSRYLPLLYSNVFHQTERNIDDVSSDDMLKVLRLRARPKIMLATNYEQAVDILSRYGENLLCLITDVEFPRNGILDKDAGFHLVKQVRKQIKGLPTVIQSLDNKNSHAAFKLKSVFINKNSETLNQDIDSFIKHHLGFGNFIYRDSAGKSIAVAKSLKDFEDQIDTVPSESLIFHGERNHFTLWLMARGEISIARMLQTVKVANFKTTQEYRDYLKYIVRKYRNQVNTGQVINFDESAILDETNIVSLGSGPLGGKGRGLAFINTLIYNLYFSEVISTIRIRTPITLVIGTDEFDLFMDRNHLRETVQDEISYDDLKHEFLKADLSFNLDKKLRYLMKCMKKPIAIRSSSMLEDSSARPFAGVFATYLLPNNHPDQNVRLQQASDAIKLVYASIYSDNARRYFGAINYRVDDEKMGIIIQEVVGNQYGGCYYPHISGTAQSYNYYPVAHMKPEDGYAVAALGLGQYVVEGEKAWRFSPNYPDIQNNNPQDQIKSSQTSFYSIHTHNNDPDLWKQGPDAALIRLDISHAERHGTMTHCASVYDPDNDRIVPGLDSGGPRILNFADILKYDYIPLAETLRHVMDVVKQSLGAPVEIEYAIDLTKDEDGRASFYLLQIKPYLGSSDDYEIDMNQINPDGVILFAEKSMGNGKIDNIKDLVFVKLDSFNKTRTREILQEIEEMNTELGEQGRNYVLIGPGRWGTQDRFLGIPVKWPQISNARVIVEMSLPDFPLDASLGSHFFHNVTSMDVGYFSVQHDSKVDRIDWEKLEMQKVISEKKFIKHIEFDEPLTIVMDGKKRTSVITWNNLCPNN